MDSCWHDSNVVQAALSLSVTTVGAGVLAIPSTMQEGGITLVLSVICFVAALTILSIDYLVLCVDTLKLRSYEDIARELLGRSFEEAIRWVLIIYSVGIAAGYIVVVGEIFSPMLPLIQPYLPFLSSPVHVMLFFWLVIMLPLACTPYITHMHRISIVAVTATLLIACVIVYRYFVPVSPDSVPRARPVTYLNISYKALLALPVMMFSFDCQSLVFQIYGNLHRPSRGAMARVSGLSVCVTGFIYATVGLFGYLSNRPHVHGNVLTNYDPLHDHLFAAGAAVYSITVILAYALVIFPCRDAVFILLCGYNTATHELAHDAISASSNLAVSLGLAIISLLLALRASGILFIIAFLGAACSSVVSFIYPAMFRLVLHARGIARCTTPELVAALVMLCFGISGCIVGTFVSIFTL